MQYVIINKNTNEVLALYKLPFNFIENRQATLSEITTNLDMAIIEVSDDVKVGDILDV